jgi:uncharacterized protein (DUF2252 family)
MVRSTMATTDTPKDAARESPRGRRRATVGGPGSLPHLSPREHSARGRAARVETPRSRHAEWEPWAERPDPIALLEEQAVSRVPELVPIRYGRMMVSAFAFFRGAAYVMASDLASTARSGFNAQLCGDAHLSNFGGFASPERDLLFDVNDFDETLPGPWEWDLKRLAASIAIAGRERGFTGSERRATVRAAVREYREAMHGFADMRNLDVWYARLDSAELLARFEAQATAQQLKTFRKTAAKAVKKDNTRAFERLAHTVDGAPQIISDPPLIVRIEDLLPAEQASEFEESIHTLLRAYRASLQGDRRHLLERYRYVDLARKVVGVGSVGTRAWVVLMLGHDEQDPLFLQCKEAQPSVLEPFLGKSAFDHHGRRVVEGQRLMQASSDIMLGWLRTTGIDGETRDFYVRQLWDWKSSADIGVMTPPGMAIYGRMCGWTLARAHGRSGDCIAIASYLGSGDTFDRAIARFAETYADQNERDHHALVQAVASGRVTAAGVTVARLPHEPVLSLLGDLAAQREYSNDRQHEPDEQRNRLTRRALRTERRNQQHHADRAREEPCGVALQRPGQQLPELDRPAHRPGQPPGEDDQDAGYQQPQCAAAPAGGRDAQHFAQRRACAFVGDQRVDHIGLDPAAQQECQQRRDDDPDADIEQHPPPRTGGEGERTDVQQHDECRQHEAETAQPLYDVLRGAQLLGAQQHEPALWEGQFGADFRAHTQTRAEPVEQCFHVDRHDTAGRREIAPAAVQHFRDARMREAVGVGPQLLYGGYLKRPVDRLRHELRRGCRERGCERCKGVRQLVGGQVLHVDHRE